jgi:MarR family transcriptional regulator, organic hydroperoxide resistance regulator
MSAIVIDMLEPHPTEATTGANSRADRETEVWQQMSEIWFSFKPRLMEICREFDLFPPQVMVLRTLDQPKPMREVASVLACNSSNLTGITDRLEDRDLVRRTSDPNDRRVKLLVLTDAGQELRERVVERLEVVPDTLEDFSDEELDRLGELLEKLKPALADA